MRNVLAGLVLAAALAPAAASAASLGGWQVSDKPDKGVCLASREYKDPDDDNKQNGVAFGLVTTPDGGQALIISLGYEGWEWDKNETVEADLKIGKKMLYKRAKWEANDKTTLVGTFLAQSVDSLLEGIGTGETMYLTFGKDSEANFLIPNAGMALGGVKLCHSAAR